MQVGEIVKSKRLVKAIKELRRAEPGDNMALVKINQKWKGTFTDEHKEVFDHVWDTMYKLNNVENIYEKKNR